MLSLLHSTFLNAISMCILWSILQMAFIWFVYVSIINTGKISFRGKYCLSILFLLIGFATTIITFFFFYTHTNYQYSSPVAINSLQIRIPALQQFTLIVSSVVMPTIALLYFVLLVKNFMVLLFQLWNINVAQPDFSSTFIVNRLEELQRFVLSHTRLFAKKIPVKIILSFQAVTPFTSGILKPVIVLPVSMFSYLTAEQIEAVVVHELAHIRRNDYLVNFILYIVETILFFNPFIKRLGEEIKNTREAICDQYVIDHHYPKLVYAEALLQIAKQRITPVSKVIVNAVDNRFHLLERIQFIVAVNTKQNFSLMYIKGLMPAILISAFLIAITNQSQPGGLSLQKTIPPIYNNQKELLKKQYAVIKEPKRLLNETGGITKNRIAPPPEAIVISDANQWQHDVEQKLLALQNASVKNDFNNPVLSEILNDVRNQLNDARLQRQLKTNTVLADSVRMVLQEKILTKLYPKYHSPDNPVFVQTGSIRKTDTPAIKMVSDTVQLNNKKEIISIYSNSKNDLLISIQPLSDKKFY